MIFVGNTDKISDSALQKYCTDKENCLRSNLIVSIGGSVQKTSRLCCSICNVSCSLPRLDILLHRPVSRKKRRVPVRKIDQSLLLELKSRLEEERNKYVVEHPCMAIFGLQFICSDNVIDKICSDAKYLTKIEDLDQFIICKELVTRFYSTIIEVIGNAPPPKRKC